MYVWDEEKRKANLAKHGLDFADAYLVYENPEKVTVASPRYGEARQLDIALVNVNRMILALAYVERGEGIRVISFRQASHKEREMYAQSEESN